MERALNLDEHVPSRQREARRRSFKVGVELVTGCSTAIYKVDTTRNFDVLCGVLQRVIVNHLHNSSLLNRYGP